MSGWVEEMSEPVHSNRKNFKCENCDFETDQKIEFLVHKYNVHGLRLVQERRNAEWEREGRKLP